ncbi:ribonuclease H1-like [Tropilaelaps mercedesae]|uniref:Ribonuclease H1 n=1 Tax=Tropilaelaps mercedesae TaxID=418985 RepID=A0A1V9Y1G2_9ACAR|nr:ribonuclease H1-like [Tropilaelaps mercedesae]
MLVWLRGFLSAMTGRAASSGGFYAVRNGRSVGVVRSWAECENLVKGFPGARYKKFSTQAEADQFVAGKDAPSSTSGAKTLLKSEQSTGHVTAQKRGWSSFTGKTQIHSDDAQKDSAPKKPRATILIEPQHVSYTSEQLPIVYTDGACSKNGKADARAGIGVYWGDGDVRNVSEPLEGRPTNNRAEIHAAVKAIRQAKEQGLDRLEIRTDSSFLIKSITQWVDGWQRKNWMSAAGKPVINREDFEILLKAQEGIAVTWTHVPGHAGVHGNEMADRLAVAGMMKRETEPETSP